MVDTWLEKVEVVVVGKGEGLIIKNWLPRTGSSTQKDSRLLVQWSMKQFSEMNKESRLILPVKK